MGVSSRISAVMVRGVSPGHRTCALKEWSAKVGSDWETSQPLLGATGSDRACYVELVPLSAPNLNGDGIRSLKAAVAETARLAV